MGGMKLKDVLHKDSLHHAYCIQGERDFVLEEIKIFLQDDLDFKILGNPDFYYEAFETFSIEESRKLKEQQQARAFNGLKIFIFSCNFITREAQNALLKIFEEPTEGTHFFLITKTIDILLPTLKSRMVQVRLSSKASENSDIEKFVKANMLKRFEYIRNIIESKEKNVAITFLDSLEQFFSSSGLKIQNTSFVREMIELKKFLFSQGSSMKLILEHIALICPKK